MTSRATHYVKYHPRASKEARVRECYYCGFEKPFKQMVKIGNEPQHLCKLCRDILLVKQKGVCAICGGVDAGRKLCIDHCHELLIIRGLLCHRCNTGIGFFKDDIFLLAKAIAYLTECLNDSKS